MGYELTYELIWLGMAVWGVCFVIASRELPVSAAAVISAIRVAIPVAYFAWYYDGTWTFLDDFEYTQQGQYLLDNGFTPFSALSAHGIDTMQALSGGRHILYIWWNLCVYWLFGLEYYVPVLINVAISFGAGWVFVQLLKEAGMKKHYRQWILAFFLLHWESIAWASFVNLKDQIVQLLTLALFLTAIRAVRRKSLPYGLASLGIVILFQSLRFYLPFLAAAAGGAWMFLEWQDIRKYLLLVGAAIAAVALGPPLQYVLEMVNPTHIAFGALHYLLTPQPWSVAPSYSFLQIPSLCHWAMFAPAMFGAFYLWKESRLARLLLLHALVLVAFYAMVEELQGVRQRAQITFVFTWLQFHFMWYWKESAFRAPLRSTRTTKQLPWQAPNTGASTRTAIQ